jgi:hypothetical protein
MSGAGSAPCPLYRCVMYPSWSRQGLQWKAHSRCALIGVPCIRKQGLPYRQLIITGGEDLQWKARPGALKKITIA